MNATQQGVVGSTRFARKNLACSSENERTDDARERGRLLERIPQRLFEHLLLAFAVLAALRLTGAF